MISFLSSCFFDVCHKKSPLIRRVDAGIGTTQTLLIKRLLFQLFSSVTFLHIKYSLSSGILWYTSFTVPSWLVKDETDI